MTKKKFTAAVASNNQTSRRRSAAAQRPASLPTFYLCFGCTISSLIGFFEKCFNPSNLCGFIFHTLID
jgi:hypothetical protein